MAKFKWWFYGLLDDIMACFGFACQYDPLHIISKKKKRQQRGDYEHQGTLEMEQMANKLTLPFDPDRQSEMMNLVTTSNPHTDQKGKRKVGQDPMIITTYASPSTNKLKVFKDPFLHIVDYPTPTMETIIGEHVDT